jgi:uncharacterized protein YeaO (DUF488 family)
MKLRTKRVSDARAVDDGVRLLVDRYWPRSIEQESAHIDSWVSELAPSPELIAWYGRKADRWPQFKQRYWEELRDPDKAVILTHVRTEMQIRGVTLLSSWRNREQNPAQALAEFIGGLPPLPVAGTESVFPVRPVLQTTTTVRYYPVVPGLDWLWLLLGLSAPITAFLTIQFVLVYRQTALITVTAAGILLVLSTLGRFIFREHHLGLPEVPRSSEGRQGIWMGILALGVTIVGVIAGLVLLALVLGLLTYRAGIIG